MVSDRTTVQGFKKKKTFQNKKEVTALVLLGMDNKITNSLLNMMKSRNWGWLFLTDCDNPVWNLHNIMGLIT